MVISGIVKSTLTDYPGLVSCVLFVPGCNFDCFYCHNRTLLDGTQDVINPQYVDDFLKKRVGKLDGVVLSGGEPTLQRDLVSYAKKIKGMGYKLKLDTNGSSPETVEKLLKAGLVDYFAVDYKAPAEKYRQICGGDAGEVLKTVTMLLEAGVSFQVRTTVIPQLSETDLRQMAKELPQLPKYVLNRYRRPEKFLSRDSGKVEKEPYTKAQIEDLAESILPLQPYVTT